MTKIKNFRINLRSRELARLLKTRDGMATTPEIEAACDQMANDAKRFVKPAAIYATLPRNVADTSTSLPLPDRAVAASVMTVTLGDGIAAEIEQARAQNDDFRQALLKAVQEEGLHQAMQFTLRLLGEQAKKEEYDLSEIIVIADAATTAPLKTLLGTERIGLAVADAPMPDYARVAWTFWTPIARRGAKKIESPARAVKAVA